MRLSAVLTDQDLIVENGPLGTRLLYDYGFTQGPSAAVRDPNGQEALKTLYTRDIEQAGDTPIILNAPTYRASQYFLQSMDATERKRLNQECVGLVLEVRDTSSHSENIIVSAPIGSMYDPYGDRLATAEEAQDYHAEQISFFQTLPIDLIYVVTIPTASEALGIAQAMQASDKEYTIGFVLNDEGLLKDGKTVFDAIQIIDALVDRTPVGYLITCTHPSLINQLDVSSYSTGRLIGVQANGSALSKKVLNVSTTAQADDPQTFASDVHALKEKFDLKILAGCCGTTGEHLCQIVQTHKAKQRP